MYVLYIDIKNIDLLKNVIQKTDTLRDIAIRLINMVTSNGKYIL